MAGIGLGIIGYWFLMGWGMRTAECEGDQFSICPQESGSFYSTSPDCLIYYQCANDMVSTKVCFPWQRFDVHQMQCRDFTEVDCNPEFTGIWRPIYSDLAETDDEMTIGEVPVQTEEIVTENQTNLEDSKPDVVHNNLPIEEEEETSHFQIEDIESTLNIISSIETLHENKLFKSTFNVLQIEEIKAEDIDYRFLVREGNIPSENGAHKAKRYVPDDPLYSEETTSNYGSQQEISPQRMLKNVLLMNIDDQSLNTILNWVAYNQLNVNNKDTGGPQTSNIGDTLAFDMNCARPVTIPTTVSVNPPYEQNIQGTSDRPMINSGSLFTTSPTNEDSSGGFWYWCGAGRFVFTQSNEEGDSLCEQLQDPQFINQEGGTQQGGDWAGHTFLG